MQSLKSKIVLTLLLKSHLFKLQLKPKPFDPSMEGIRKFRNNAETASKKFGKLPKEIEINPVSIGDRYAEWVKIQDAFVNKVILYFHGGMYLFGSPQTHRQHVAKFVTGSKINALVFDYRLAPEHPFPAALEDSIAAYRFLLNEGFKHSEVVFAGDSVGGGLCLATLIALKEKEIPLPAAAAVLSPWTDLMLTGNSYKTNQGKCFSPIGCAENASVYYAGENDKRNPLISPLYGDLKGLPALHITAGGNEILLDDAVQFAKKAEEQGIDVTLKVEKGMCHCYPVFGNLFRESKMAMEEICKHLQKNIR